jgi:hypothetical protein
MARITVTIPDSLHMQVLKLAKKEGGSVSYTVSKLVELGLLVTNSKGQNQEDNSLSKIDEHCTKLLIQINGIIKEIAVENFEFTPEKIARITQETNDKYRDIVG